MRAFSSVEDRARTVRTLPSSGLAAKQLLVWFAVGAVAAALLVLLQVSALQGNWEELLHVGTDSPLRGVIEDELGSVAATPGPGHDGQLSYVIALDPLGGQHADFLDDAGYRWRRILFPLLGGWAGALGGRALLFSLVAWAVVGMGMATMAVVDIGAMLGLGRWVAAATLTNLGLWFSVQLVTSDALAVGLALVGVSLAVRSRHGLAVVALAAAALAKDQYLLMAWSVALWMAWRGERSQATHYVVLTAVPVVAWILWLQVTIGDALSARGNIAAPVVGIVEGIGKWRLFDQSEQILGAVALAALVLAAVTPLFARSVLLRILAWPWVGLGLVLSDWVWKTGNNSLRVLLPLWLFGMIGLVALLDADRRLAVSGTNGVGRETGT